MGDSYSDFQTAQHLAQYYANKQRVHMRRAVGYTAGLVILTGLLAMISTAFIIPGLILSGAFYLGYRYGGETVARAKTWWNKKKSRYQGHGTDISMQSLLTDERKAKIAQLVEHDIPTALTQKSGKASKYEFIRHLGEQYVNTYYGYKHFRALTQYNMLRTTQNNCIHGDLSFVTLMANERTVRRDKKIEILKLFLEKLNAGTLSVNMTFIPTRMDVICTLAGPEENAFLAQVAEINLKGPIPLVEKPADLTSLRLYLCHTLLPLVFDAHEVVRHVQSLNAGQFISKNIDGLLIQQNYPITAEYIERRLRVLEKSREGNLDQTSLELPVVNEEREFDLSI